MAKAKIFTFRLFGAYRGVTKRINGHQFVDGNHSIAVDPERVAALMQVLGYYGGYAKGTTEYDKHLAVEQAIDLSNQKAVDLTDKEPETDGTDDILSKADEGSATRLGSEVQQTGAEPAEETSDNGSGTGDSSGGSAGSGALGDGHSDSGLSKFEESEGDGPSEPSSEIDNGLKRAVLALDPEAEEHWIARGRHAGKPALTAVEEALGRAGVTRSDVEDAMPAYTRKVAQERASVEI